MGESTRLILSARRRAPALLALALAGCHLGFAASHTVGRSSGESGSGIEAVSATDSSYDLDGALELGKSGATLHVGTGIGLFDVTRRSEGMAITSADDFDVRFPIGLSYGIPIPGLAARPAAYVSYDYYWIGSGHDDDEGIDSILEAGLEVTAGSFFVRMAYSKTELTMGAAGAQSTSGMTIGFGLRVHNVIARLAKSMAKEDE